MTRSTVYRCFDAEGVLLYVGCTEMGMERFISHRTRTGWWLEVASITVEHHATRRGAYAAELAAIKAESPRYNRAGADTKQRASAARHADRNVA